MHAWWAVGSLGRSAQAYKNPALNPQLKKYRSVCSKPVLLLLSVITSTATTIKISSKSTPLLNFCMFNAWSLLNAGQLADFEDQAAKINFDVIRLAEVRRRGAARLDLSSGYSLFYSRETDQSWNGIGFYTTQN
uniref:Uncharacterized protein n=1 Tax=Plectus sambesii TaxID=2011161 RepID=A0A914UL07_9BILA